MNSSGGESSGTSRPPEPRNARRDSRGWWILAVGLGIGFVSLSLSESFNESVLSEIHFAEDRPSGGPPLYYVRGDYVKGMFALVGLLVALIFSVFTWNYSRTYTHMMQWMVILGFGPAVAEAIYIDIQCEQLLSIQATCPWPTFDSYMRDPARSYVWWIPMVIAGVYAVAGGWWLRRLRHEQSQSEKLPRASQ